MYTYVILGHLIDIDNKLQRIVYRYSYRTEKATRKALQKELIYMKDFGITVDFWVILSHSKGIIDTSNNV